jgi:hypothetical protein
MITHTFLSYLVYFFLEWEIFRTNIVEKIRTHILCSVTFFENRAVYEIMWKNILQRGRSQMAMAHAHCMLDTNATNTHTSCVIFIAFPLQQWLQEHASMLRYTYLVIDTVRQIITLLVVQRVFLSDKIINTGLWPRRLPDLNPYNRFLLVEKVTDKIGR